MQFRAECQPISAKEQRHALSSLVGKTYLRCLLYCLCILVARQPCPLVSFGNAAAATTAGQWKRDREPASDISSLQGACLVTSNLVRCLFHFHFLQVHREV
jgi:hypothetical protein